MKSQLRALIDRGRQDEGLRLLERCLEVSGDDPSVLYNAGCIYALSGQAERALDLLDAAVGSGWGSRDWLEHDPDLDSLRGDPRFAEIVARTKGGR